MKPWKLESMYQRAGLTCYKSTSHKLRILYLKSFFFLNKFQLFREFLKSPLREQMSWRQSKNWVRRYTLDKRGWRSLLSKHWFWLWHGAREISFNVVSYLCCKEKTDYTSSISQKHLMGVGKHTENKEIYPSFKKSGDSGFMKGQRNLSLITSQPTRLTRLHPISDWEKVIAFWFDITIGCKRSQNKGVCYWAILHRQ